MKPIILIMSCKRDKENGNNQAIRDTWLKSWGGLIDYRFVLGDGNVQENEDEIIVSCDDRYLWLTEKVFEAYKWAASNNYTHTFKCDTDTYVHIPRLLKSDFSRADYIGHVCRNWYMAGGCGYWLGPKALSVITNRPLHIYHRAEDLNIGQYMKSNDISLTHDSRYTLWCEQDLNKGKVCKTDNDIISIHLTYNQDSGGYNKDWMYAAHKITTGEII